MSIRARLLIATVALVAIGLLAANVVTYAALKSSLTRRIDQQLQASRLLALRALREPGPRALGSGGADAPRATYAELRDPQGGLIASQSFGFSAVEAAPELPADLPGSGGRRLDRSTDIFTTEAEGGRFEYRVLAAPLTDRGGTLIIAIPMVEAAETLRRLVFVEILVTAALLLAMGALALWVVRIGLRPLEQMGTTADAIAGGDLSKRVEPADHRTEAGRLGLALNAMLGRIENAFAERRASETRLRRFVADASHELRTPLTSIRGYAELFRRGADTRPEDLAKSMSRIEEESARMGKLVEELLLLAQLDQRPELVREPVDLAAMVEEIAADPLVVADGHPLDLDVPDELVVNGDETRLRQVISNLVANSFVHTPAGTPVHVRLSRNGSDAVVEVADEGPGMAQSDAERVFDRFYRVDPSRSRERGGAGLGLSIAHAIVEAHGGKLSVTTMPGEGSTFRATIPMI